jgi:HPt (histidine-containing phosphotransfer) domain-containing protein
VAKPIRPDELAAALSRVQPLERKEEKEEMRSDEAGGGFDSAALESLRELGGDDFVVEVIDTFLEDAPGLLVTIRRSLDEGDTDELRRAAHTLKSNGATLGAGEFSELCRELEQRAKNGELDDAAELADRIKQEYGVLEKALAALRPRPAA